MIKSIGYGITTFAVIASLLSSPAQAGYFKILDDGDNKSASKATNTVQQSPEDEARIRALRIPPTLDLQPPRYWSDDQFMSYCCAPTWIAFMVATFLYNHVLN